MSRAKVLDLTYASWSIINSCRITQSNSVQERGTRCLSLSGFTLDLARRSISHTVDSCANWAARSHCIYKTLKCVHLICLTGCTISSVAGGRCLMLNRLSHLVGGRWQVFNAYQAESSHRWQVVGGRCLMPNRLSHLIRSRWQEFNA